MNTNISNTIASIAETVKTMCPTSSMVDIKEAFTMLIVDKKLNIELDAHLDLFNNRRIPKDVVFSWIRELEKYAICKNKVVLWKIKRNKLGVLVLKIKL